MHVPDDDRRTAAVARLRAAYGDDGSSDGLFATAMRAWEFGDRLRALGREVDSTLSAKRLLPELGTTGLVGTMVPREYGGAGLGCRHNLVVQAELAAVAPSLAVLRAVSAVFVSQPLVRFGSEGQKRRWLPGIADGTITASLAITESEAGSDALSMATRATRVSGGYELRGAKHYVSSAAEAAFILLYAVTDPEAPRESRFSAFLVPTDLPGITLAEPFETFGVRGVSHTGVTFSDVRLDPDEHLVGEEGQGLRIMEYGLVPERIDIAARAVGCARGAFLEACRFAVERRQFGRTISKFQAVSHRIADMATTVEAASLLTMDAARRFDEGEDPRTEASMAKLFAAENGWAVCDGAMQILGSTGYTVGWSPVEMLLRDIRVLRLGGGTDEIMRHIIQSSVLAPRRSTVSDPRGGGGG